jgi:hypothetical protein
MKKELKIGDRVRYIHEDTEEAKATGFFPPIGTHGTVMEISEDGPRVQWDSGTRGDGDWWCYFEDVEKVYHYRVEVLIGTRRFSCVCSNTDEVYDALCDIFLELTRTKKEYVDYKGILAEMESGERISYNECPISICRINGEGV